MSKITTDDCKKFLITYFQSRNIDTTFNQWKRTRKYKLKNIWYRDFEHPSVGYITLKEINDKLDVVLNLDIQSPKSTKRSMASLYEGMYDEMGEQLVGGSVVKTIKSLLYDPNSDYELISSCINDVDDDDTPVTGYYIESEGRNYTLLVYADNSWISSSD